MKYTEKQSNVFLSKMQERLNKTGKTIGFTALFNKTKPPSIAHVVGTALNLRPTTTYGKIKRRQSLGFSRSLQDLYLIVKHYFPEATIFEVRDELRKRRHKGEINAMFCYQHSKMMFYKKEHGNYYPDNEDLSHYGIF